jgi:beta-glucosidase
MSDWFGTHSTAPAALAGLDLEMPGPSAWLGPTLADAVRAGDVPEPVLDEMVVHLLRLMDRVGILEGDPSAGQAEREEDAPGRRAVARRVVTEGTVLLHNDGLLPLDPSAVSRVAVIGPNAGQLEAGGGSSEVTPHRRCRLFEAIGDRLPGATVVHEVGCRIGRGLPTIDVSLTQPEAGKHQAGLRVDYFDNPDRRGDPVRGETAHMGRLTWVGEVGPGLPSSSSSVRIRTTFTPDVNGPWQWGLESAGRSLLRLNGDLVVDNTDPTRGQSFYGAGSALVEREQILEAGRPYALEVEVWPRSASSPILGVRIAADRPSVPDEFDRAVAAAEAAEVAVVVIGSNGLWESEGFDRPDLSRPGRQCELVEAVIAANPRTVVVVNAGSPVELPWAARAGAVLVAWYPGEEGADAIADMLVGLSEPSGRLPVSFPGRIEDTPAFPHYPGAEGKVVYGEGVFVGYRHYETTGLAPQFPFGHGLSYTTFAYGEPVVAQETDRMSLTVPLTNTGGRTGSEVVQVYVRPLAPRLPLPDRELGAFAKVTLAPGESRSVVLELERHAFAYWDVETHGWRADPGAYELLIGSSSRNIHHVVNVALT